VLIIKNTKALKVANCINSTTNNTTDLLIIFSLIIKEDNKLPDIKTISDVTINKVINMVKKIDFALFWKKLIFLFSESLKLLSNANIIENTPLLAKYKADKKPNDNNPDL
jgi:hypothetical protein